MGLMAALDLKPVSTSASKTLVTKLASSKPGAWLMSKAMHRLDQLMFKATHGRHTPSAILAGLPIVMISTIGAKSGQVRTSPLVGVPHGDDIALVGTNFGQTKTPGWVYNLEANPEGVAKNGEAEASFVARLANDEESEQVLAAAGKMYVGYDKYRDRISGRTVRVFILSPR